MLVLPVSRSKRFCRHSQALAACSQVATFMVGSVDTALMSMAIALLSAVSQSLPATSSAGLGVFLETAVHRPVCLNAIIHADRHSVYLSPLAVSLGSDAGSSLNWKVDIVWLRCQTDTVL